LAGILDNTMLVPQTPTTLSTQGLSNNDYWLRTSTTLNIPTHKHPKHSNHKGLYTYMKTHQQPKRF